MDSLQQIAYAKISASSNKRFASVVHVRSRVFALQFDQCRRNLRPVFVNSPVRRGFEGSDVCGGFLQDQRWKGTKKKTRSNCLGEQDTDFKITKSEEKCVENPNDNQVGFSSPSPGLKGWRLEKSTCACILGGPIMIAVSSIMVVLFMPRGPDITLMRVAYTDFLRKIENDQIQTVEVTGAHIRFRLKEIEKYEGPDERFVHSTIRPRDLKTPYQKLMEKGIEFGYRDKLWEEPDFIVFMPKLDELLGRIQMATYSDFLGRIDNDQVEKVEVDGVHIKYTLKEIEMKDDESVAQKIECQAAALQNVAPTKRIVYKTIRPNDIKTPYQKMVENGVEFRSHENWWEDPNFIRMCQTVLLVWVTCYVLGWIYRNLPENLADFKENMLFRHRKS